MRGLKPAGVVILLSINVEVTTTTDAYSLLPDRARFLIRALQSFRENSHIELCGIESRLDFVGGPGGMPLGDTLLSFVLETLPKSSSSLQATLLFSFRCFQQDFERRIVELGFTQEGSTSTGSSITW